MAIVPPELRHLVDSDTVEGALRDLAIPPPPEVNPVKAVQIVYAVSQPMWDEKYRTNSSGYYILSTLVDEGAKTLVELYQGAAVKFRSTPTNALTRTREMLKRLQAEGLLQPVGDDKYAATDKAKAGDPRSRTDGTGTS